MSKKLKVNPFPFTGTVEGDIEVLASYITQFEENDKSRPSEEIRQLLEKLFYVHATVESYLEDMLIHANIEGKYKRKKLTKKELRTIFRELGFKGKLNKLHNIMLISPEAYDLNNKLNEIRNNFVHSRAETVKTYSQSKKEQLEAIEVMVDSLAATEFEWELYVHGEELNTWLEEMEKRAKEEGY